ncbi:Fanconi anemia group B protein [Spea bombifrons]|uniref:Fanconi anemia group B protein n=1 Tax=Spea bombifrons TaxID=233779 RepID=UPI002349F03B|nr:Fanconi anemia group B protein [Spea bombifrons]
MKPVTEKRERVLTYNGEVITFQISQTADGAKTHVLRFFRRTFNATSGKFTETAAGQYGFPAAVSAVEFVNAACVADFRNGLKAPCVLLNSKSKKKSSSQSKVLVLVLHGSDEMECCMEISADAGIQQDVQVADGPTLLWRQQERLFYASPSTSGVSTAPVSFAAFHWVGSIEEELIIVGIKNTNWGNESSSSAAERTLKSTEFMVYSLPSNTTISGTHFVPNAYSRVIRCLHVCSLQLAEGNYETSVVAASDKQLILFRNGVPEEVCQLPFENPCKLQVACASRGDLLFVVLFASGDACAIWKDSLKVSATWQHVRDILVDDFLGVGFDQILTLFMDDPSALQEFTLTDCSEINYPADASSNKELAEEEFHENRFRTVQALEARLQAGLLSLEELQYDLQVKDRVFKSSCEALINMVQGKEGTMQPEEKEGLVSLWDDDGGNCPYSAPVDTCFSSAIPDCFVEKVWQRIIDDVLVVGVKLNNSVSMLLCDVGLSLILDEELAPLSPVTTCQTNVLKLALSSSLVSAYQEEPLAKKQRLSCYIRDSVSGDCLRIPCSPSYQSDLEHTITAVTELSPLLALNNTSCVLLLHARRKNQPDSLLRSKKLIVPCGKISLSLEDVLKGNHTVNLFEHCQGEDSVEDIFAVLSAFKKQSFHLLSPDCTLTSVKVWLMGQMQGAPLKHIPEITCIRKPGRLQGTLFIWNLKNPCEGILTVFYRNNSILLQCLHSLKSVLPPTCVINTTVPEGKDCLTARLAQSLEEELLALRSSVSSAESILEKESRCKKRNKTCSTIDSLSDTRARVQQYREELQTEQMQSDLEAHLTVDGDLYRQNLLEIAEIQMNSDSLACRLAKM